MSKLNVEIVTPERRRVQSQADEVIAPGADGLFGVRPGHTPYLALMQPGALSVRDAATTTSYFVAGGFVEVGPETVRVLADAAEAVASIDIAAAQKRLATAQEKLKGFDLGDVRGNEFRTAIALENKRIELASKR